MVKGHFKLIGELVPKMMVCGCGRSGKRCELGKKPLVPRHERVGVSSRQTAWRARGGKKFRVVIYVGEARGLWKSKEVLARGRNTRAR